MGDTNRVNLAYAVETGFAENPPAPTPTLKDLRIVSESLALQAGSVSSNELRSDGQIPDLIRTSASVAGNIALELSYGSYDDLLQYLLLEDVWSSASTVTSLSLEVTAGSGSFTVADPADGFGAFSVGQRVKISGFSETANNGIGIITAKANDGEITVSGLGNGVNDTDGTITRASEIVNSNVLNTLVMERQYLDGTNDFARFFGVGVESFTLNASTEAIVTGQFNFLGKIETSGTASVGTGTNTAAGSTRPFQTVDQLEVFIDNAELNVTDANLSIGNGLRTRLQIGELGPASLGRGTFNITGSVTAYYESPALYARFLGDTAFRLSWIFSDQAGNVLVFDLPSCRFRQGTRAATGGNNTDVTTPLDFTAIRNPAEDVTIRISRFPSA